MTMGEYLEGQGTGNTSHPKCRGTSWAKYRGITSGYAPVRDTHYSGSNIAGKVVSVINKGVENPTFFCTLTREKVDK